MTLKEKIVAVTLSVILLVGIIYVSHWISTRGVDSFVKNIKQEFVINNQAIFDNIARLKAKQEILDEQLKSSKQQLQIIKNTRRKEFDDVVKKGDPNELASFFDKTIDSTQLGE
jgi:predicted DNA-binding protein YlxM (UPF0122 family)